MGGVGACVRQPVTPEDAPGVAAVKADEEGGGHHAQTGEAGGEKVDRVVQPGRRRAEVAVAVVLVAKKRVQGIDRLVEHGPQRAGEGGVEKRRGDAVHNVFRHRLYRGADHSGLVERFGVPAHDHPHPPPGFWQVAGHKGRLHLHGVAAEVVQGHGGIEQIEGHERVGKRMQGAGGGQERDGCATGAKQDEEHGGGAGQPAVAEPAAEGFAPRGQPANGLYRMGPGRRVADHGVEQQGGRELPGRRGHHRSSRRYTASISRCWRTVSANRSKAGSRS